MSELIDDGGPAFPHMGKIERHNPVTGQTILSPIMTGGMTLRDWFAGQAIAGFAANPKNREWTARKCAYDAYQYADEMIKARKEKQ